MQSVLIRVAVLQTTASGATVVEQFASVVRCIAVLVYAIFMFTDESWPRGRFLPAETLVQNDTADDNDTDGGTLNKSVLGFLVG